MSLLRLAGFFVVTLIVLQVLRLIPVVGALFEVPILGFWGAAIVVAVVVSKYGNLAVDRTLLRRKLRTLEHVDTPHNLGKRGSLLLAAGRVRAAIEPLQRAVEGEPESLEWSYRLGLAHLAAGQREGAVGALKRVALEDPEYAYGGVQLALARAFAGTGRKEEALAALECFEANHGASPESAYRRGVLLKALGRRDEARVALAAVGEIVRRAGGHQRRGSRGWAARALFARWF